MPNYFGIAFVGVLACAGVGLEYHRQSVIAGVPVTAFTPSEFVAGVSASIESALSERTAQAQDMQRTAARKGEMRRHLPEAPEGWTRRGFDEGDNLAVVPEGKTVPAYGKKHPMHGFVFETLAGSKTLKKVKDLQGKGESADEVMHAHVTASSYVYAKGDESVYIEVGYRADQDEKLTGSRAKFRRQAIMAKLGRAPEQPTPFAVIAGVPFYEARGAGGAMLAHYRVLYAKIGLGQEVRLRVHANASSRSTREILNAIDFEALNTILPAPMHHVANGAALASFDEEVKYAAIATYFRTIGTTDLLTHEMNSLKPNGAGGKPEALVAKYGNDASVAEMIALRHRDVMQVLAGYGPLAGRVIDVNDMLDQAMHTDTPIALAQPEAGASGAPVEAAEAEPTGPAPEMSAALERELAAQGGALAVQAMPLPPRAAAPVRPRPAAVAQVAAPASPAASPAAKPAANKVKVKRLGGGNAIARRTTGCGGARFCKVSN